jgi:hypothetical protein
MRDDKHFILNETILFQLSCLIYYQGKAFSCKDYIPRSVVVKGMRHYCGEQEDFEMYRFCSEQSRKIAIQFNKLSTAFPCKVNKYF